MCLHYTQNMSFSFFLSFFLTLVLCSVSGQFMFGLNVSGRNIRDQYLEMVGMRSNLLLTNSMSLGK